MHTALRFVASVLIIPTVLTVVLVGTFTFVKHSEAQRGYPIEGYPWGFIGLVVIIGIVLGLVMAVMDWIENDR